MLARRELPAAYARWNSKWGAPSGRRVIPGLRQIARSAGVTYRLAPILGPFAFQVNSSTREFEYPWVYEALRPGRGLRVLELGGALSGLQFALARAGCEVHNVDPFLDYGDGGYGPMPEERHRQLNRSLRTDVRLHKGSLPDVELAGDFDAIFSVSTLEHIPRGALEDTLRAVRRLLRPGGHFVCTIDLFLDLEPFCRRERNMWGTNVPPRWVADFLEMRLVQGDPAELFGFKEFEAGHILERLADFSINTLYPQLTQLIVLEATPQL
jgi:SAM-dependent methyltransferase